MRNCGIAGLDATADNPLRGQGQFAHALLTWMKNSGVEMHTGIQLNGSAFWVVHRSQAYGPFDYEWSPDFRGVEFQYQGQKFGEYCSADEIYADLKDFALPQRVYEVASISIATILKSIMDGVPENDRAETLAQQLTEMGFPQFATIEMAEHHG